MLLVGNHSGGNLTPDTMVFTLAFYTYFGVERRLLPARPQPGPDLARRPVLRQFGTVAASHENARKALEAGAAVLVYPGGDWEVHRPSWQSDKVDFAGRKGFVRWRSTPASRSSRWSRSAARRPRSSSATASGSRRPLAPRQALPPQGAADLARAPLDHQRRRLPRPPAAARQDHGPGAGADRPPRALRGGPRPRRGLRVPHRRRCRTPLDGLAAERRLPVIG